jgi:hypothetical protein
VRSPRHLPVVAVAALVLCAWAATASAQPPGCVPYRNGKKAIDAKQWAQAITELKKAEQADPNSTDAKPCEGNLSDPYYPQYYLGVAYFNLQDYRNASLYIQQAKNRGKKGSPPKEAKELERYVREIEVGLNPRPNEFDAALARAEQALRPGSCASAAKDFAAAKGISDYWFNKEGKSARLAAAEKCAQADQLYADAKALFDKGQIGQAQQRASAAVAAYSDEAPATALLGEIQKRNGIYDEQKRAAEQNAGAGRPVEAKASYIQARSANPERFASDGLDGRISALDRDIARDASLKAAAETERLRQEKVQRAIGNAQAAFDGGRFGEVASLLDQGAREANASEKARADSLRTRAQSQMLLADGRGLAEKRKYKDAEAKFQAALKADAANTDASAALDVSTRFADLEQRGRQMAGKRDPKARDILLQAQDLDRARFQRENLTGVLASVPQPVAPPPPPPPPKPEPKPEPPKPEPPKPEVTKPQTTRLASPLDAALMRLFSGEVSNAIPDLESVASGANADRRTQAIAHAYLGVAHATLALSASDDSAGSRREKALSEFRQARKLKADIALSAKLVSPRIRELFEQSRTQ